MGFGQTSDRWPRSGAMVHDRLPPCAACRGLAGDARPLARLPVAAVQFLRPQPSARCAAGRCGGEMKRPVVLVAAVAMLVSGIPEPMHAGDGPGDATSTAAAGALLYMDGSDWRAADQAQKTALAADFMRIYCGNRAMPAPDLVACLDEV